MPNYLNNTMILFINTNSKEEIKFFLSDKTGNILFSKTNIIDFKDSQKILSLLEEFLKESNIELSTINYLTICNGPGINMNFRIGIIMTNSLAYILKIPIISVLSTEFNSDQEFIKIGINKLKNKEHKELVLPEYSIKKS